MINGKNIIILLKSFTLGGAEKQALFLASYLQNQKNCNVYVYSYIHSTTTELFDLECEKHQLKNLFFVKNPLSAAGRFKYLKRRVKLFLLGLKLRKHNPDIIIPYLNPPSIIASLCYKVAGAKCTFWHHRGVDYYRNDAIEKRAVKKTPFFIANSENGKQELQEKFEIKNKEIHFLPNFSTINLEVIDKEIQQRDSEDKIVIGMIAHFRGEKLQDILVKSFKELIDTNKNIELLLVGNVNDQSKEEQEDFNNIKKFIVENQLNEHVKIMHNTDGNKVFPLIDIGVLLSTNEGMPNVIMEYMAYKLPVVTNKHAGCATLLGDDYKYFTDNTVESVGTVLNKLLLDKNEREKVGTKNFEKLKNNYSIEKYMHNLENILAL